MMSADEALPWQQPPPPVTAGAIEKGDVGDALQVALSGDGGWESGCDCGVVAAVQ
jgi:hypothetical protein